MHYPESTYIEEAEIAALSAILHKPEQLDKHADKFKPDNFFHEHLRDIAKAMINLKKNGKVISPPSLLALMGKEAGETIANITQSLMTVQGLPDFLDTVNDCAEKRRVYHTLNDCLRELERSTPNMSSVSEQLVNALSTSTENKVASAQNMFNDTLDIIEKRQSGEKVISTGFYCIDQIIGGLYPDNLYFIAARPGMGKTALALNMADNISRRGETVLYFSLEMPKYQLVQRLIARRTGISVTDMNHKGKLGKDEFAKIMECKQDISNSFIIDDRAALSIDDIFSVSLEQSCHHNISLVVVDYLTLMKLDGGGNKTDQIGHVTKNAKELSKRLNCPVLVLSQLNRGVEHRDNKRPMLADLRSSGDIEQDADIVMFIYRHEYYLQSDDDMAEIERHRGKAEVIVAKNRHGDTRTAHLNFSGKNMEFYEREQ